MPADTPSKITLIFPMAGQGARFEYQFKPFLKYCGKTFIENAVEPFIKHKSKIAKTVFVFTQKQEKDHNVSAFLHTTFDNIFEVECHILPEQTDNQYQTVYQSIHGNVTGPIIVCDCDHRLNVDCFFNDQFEAECIVPVWKIDMDEVKHWSVIGLDADKKPISISEKSVPSGADSYFGCIGCTYFKNAAELGDIQHKTNPDTTTISEAIQRMIKGGSVAIAQIYEGYFFGDQEKLNDLEAERENLLLSAKEVLHLAGGSFATTNIMKLSGGQMVVRKTVAKDKNLDLGYTKLKQQYKKMRTLYKMLPSSVARPIHDLENQSVYFYDLEYLSGYKELHKFSNADIATCLNKVLDGLKGTLYSDRNRCLCPPDNAWLDNHLENKIYSKLDKITQIDESFNAVINGDIFYANGFSCYGIRYVLDNLLRFQHVLSPTFLSVVHGDLTFSNIMYNEEDFCLLDCDGSEQFDNPALDFGKMCQSIFGRYEKWCNDTIKVNKNSPYDFEVPSLRNYRDTMNHFPEVEDAWAEILGVSKKKLKVLGYFYCALHFIRMIPFRLEIDYDQGLYALILGGFYLSKTLEQLEK